jgi:uncharacterized repeat protein (TIGR01451 family)
VLAFVSASAHAQTRVENVAGYTYTDAEGVVRGGRSNLVVTDILDIQTAPKVEYFVEGPGGTPTMISGGCSTTQPTTVNLVPAQAAAAGTSLYVVVTDAFSNKSATAIDTVFMSVRSGTSTVNLTLVETGVDTGRFAGVVRTTLAGTPADACTLAVGADGDLSGNYTNGVTPAIVPTLEVSPFNVVFDSSTREIVDGSVVSIIDAATGAEAKPLGVDGRSSYPATVTAGQTYTDSSGHRYLVPKGGFTFPMLPAGSYKIVVRPAGTYSFPSASSPEDFADKPVVAGKVVNVLADASYGRAFTVSQNAIFDADVPLDGGQGSIVVSKAVSVDRASPGDYLQYRVIVQNAGASGTLSRPTLTDVMPKGIRFQKGSLKVDGVRVADPKVANDGETMTATLPALASGKSYTLTYVGLVTSNAPIGDAVNQASVRSGGVVSSIARAGVRIDGGLFSDAVTIIGRVVSDSCTIDGKTAKPVPGVRILLEDGTYVVTDDNGQYHIENVRPGLHVAQMDRNSFPEGYRPAKCGDDTRRGGSDISQFVDARGGALWRADFFLDRAPGAQAPSSQVAPALTPSPLTTPSLMGSASPLSNASMIPGSADRVVDASPLAAPVAVTQTVPTAQPAEVAAALDTSIVVTAKSITSTIATPKVDPKLSAEDRDSIAAAGGGINWIERATGATEILFPAAGHNPRTSVTRIVVAHGGNDAAAVSVNGKPVEAILYEGSTTNPTKTAGVDVWNAVPLVEGDNVIDVQIKSADGKITKLTRTVAFVNTAEQAQIVPTSSKLIADGRTNPVIAVRVVDAKGRPVRAGVSGRLDVSAPYMTADSIQRRRDSQLIQQNTASQSTWTVKGDDGIAYVELAPTTQTGEVRLNMHLRDRSQSETRLRDSGSVLDRRDELAAWLSPGDQEWVVVGFGAASAGYTTLARQAEALTANPGDTSIVDGQVKLYAKGRVKGRWLLTLAYDSDKRSDRQRRQSVLSTIDPDAYYTLYGDTAQQGYDAQSTKDIFVKIETRQFYALFGDFTTGISDTELGQYQRTLTGLKTQYQSQKTGITAFVASTPFRHERDEIQGMGLTGPYQLQRRDLVLNTERVRVETRDAQRPELIKSTRDLVRFQDYDVDYARGTITLRAPLTSRDASFDPNFLVIDYETYGDAQNRLVAGSRVTRQVGGKVLVGATGIHSDDDARTSMGTIDATVQVDASTRVRAEAGYSIGRDRDGHAYIVEAQRRTDGLDARVYVREQTLDFGVGQQNAVEAGYRKIGADVATRLTKGIELAGSAYSLGDLTSQAQRQGIRADVRAQIDANTNVTANVQHVRERGTAGEIVSTTQLGGTASRALMNGKLIVTGEAATTISGDSTVATPTRYRVGGSYAFTQSIRGVVDHEIATGSGVTGANTRVGVETQPWNGATVGASWNSQSIAENGERTYGAFGAKQSFRIGKRWSADLSVDSQRTIKGIARPDVVNPLNPPSLGGRVDNGYFDDDFTSLSAGLGYQTEKTSWTGRVETRQGDNRRYGLTTALVHQLADGKVWGGSASAYRLNQYDGGGVDHADAAFAIALRRPDSRLQLLDKLEMIYDGITLGSGSPSSSGVYGLPASQNAIGVLAGSDYGPVAATSNRATSLRFVNNLAINWIAAGSEDHGTRTQVSFYYGSKYGIQTFDGDRFGGYTDMVSIEARHDVTRWLDIGIQAGARHSWSQGTMQWSLGPTIGVSPIKNSWLSLGYNVTGFEDRDFAGARSTIKGPWVAFRMKFDEETLGLARRRR